MIIGYACHTVGVLNTEIKGCILKNATEERLSELIQHNLRSLENIIEYNFTNGIKLFRISSDIIPFGSSPVNTLNYRELYKERLLTIGNKIKETGLRVSMHPGQYTVLNSPDVQVVSRAVDDLKYHTGFLDSLGVDSSNKIILHIGGAYGDKKTSIQRFLDRYTDLNENIKKRLVIENDDKSYHIGDVLEIGIKAGIPVVYDNLHNKLNICDPTKDDFYWIKLCHNTWKEKDGRQKVHYSQQDKTKGRGAHSDTIAINEFMQFYESIIDINPDIMLEVKDKNISALKCMVNIR